MIWFDPGRPAGTRAAITRALAAAGVESAPRGASAVTAVFFATVGEDVLVAVSRLAAEAAGRLVAVAAGGAEVDDRDAWRLVSAGASDVFSWSHSDTPAQEIAARMQRWGEIDAELESDRVAGTLVGRCAAWRRAIRDVIEVARYSRSDVLLTGESGTGKELAAHLIHDLDPRPEKGPFVTLDCTTVVPTLAGSEFFGHERGAFTGAVAARDGAFALADGGTLFLDEIGELPAGAAGGAAPRGAGGRLQASRRQPLAPDALSAHLGHPPRSRSRSGRRPVPARLPLPHRSMALSAAAAARAPGRRPGPRAPLPRPA